MSSTTTCRACLEHLRHTAEDWKNHLYAGHGYQSGQGWSHPGLEKEKKTS